MYNNSNAILHSKVFVIVSSFSIIVMLTSTHQTKIHEVSHEFCVFTNFRDESFQETASKAKKR